jgi:hypothetical protein
MQAAMPANPQAGTAQAPAERAHAAQDQAAPTERRIVDAMPMVDSPADDARVVVDKIVELGPPERSAARFPVDAAPGRLVIYRDGSKPDWRTPKVSVGAGQALRPKPNTYGEFVLPPGVHRVRVDWAADTVRPDLVFDIRIAPGRVDYVRLRGTYTATGPQQFQVGTFAEWVAPEAAAAELRACCRRLRGP